MIKLIIADDHKLLCDGLKVILTAPGSNIQIVGEAFSGSGLLKLLTEQQADVVLMDILMPENSDLETTQYIIKQYPKSKILILSMLDHERYVAEAIRAGVLGYLLKNTSQMELVYAIQAVARGETYISAQIAIQLLKKYYSRPVKQVSVTSPALYNFSTITVPKTLSVRESEVLQLIAKGYTNEEIANILNTSKRTVEVHRMNLLEKTDSKNTASLIRYAYKYGLLEENKPADTEN